MYCFDKSTYCPLMFFLILLNNISLFRQDNKPLRGLYLTVQTPGYWAIVFHSACGGQPYNDTIYSYIYT